MGSRNLDRIHISEWRDKVRTAAEIWTAGWKVRAYCEACANEQVVDLEHVVRLGGPGVILWDKTSRCKRIVGPGGQCTGRVFFKAMPRGAAGFDYLGKAPRAMQADLDRGAGVADGVLVNPGDQLDQGELDGREPPLDLVHGVNRQTRKAQSIPAA